MRFLADESCESPGLAGLRLLDPDFLEASAGIPATEVQAPMGHEDLATTQQYVRVTGRDLERAMARLKAWREAGESVAQEVKDLTKPAKPRPERPRRPGTESSLQTLSDHFSSRRIPRAFLDVPSGAPRPERPNPPRQNRSIKSIPRPSSPKRVRGMVKEPDEARHWDVVEPDSGGARRLTCLPGAGRIVAKLGFRGMHVVG